MNDSINKQVRSILEDREEIIKAFIAKHGFDPDEMEQVHETTENGSCWYLRKRLIPSQATEFHVAKKEFMDVMEYQSQVTIADQEEYDLSVYKMAMAYSKFKPFLLLVK